MTEDVRDDAFEALERASTGGVAFEDVIEAPLALEPRPRTLFIVDRRAVETGRPWHLVGVALLILLGAFVAWRTGTGTFSSAGASMTALSVAVLGLVLVFKGRPRKSMVEVPLAWLDSRLGLLRVREHAQQRHLTESSNIGFADVREVLYAERHFRLPSARTDARVAGAAVFIRLWDGAVWPIIPATLARQEAYAIALGVAQRVGVGVKQVGVGWSDKDATEASGKRLRSD